MKLLFYRGRETINRLCDISHGDKGYENIKW